MSSLGLSGATVQPSPVRSTNPSPEREPEIRTPSPKPVDEDVVMSESDGETPASVLTDTAEPASSLPSAAGSAPVRATAPAVLDTHDDDDDDDNEEEEEEEEDGKIDAAGSASSSLFNDSVNPSCSPARPTPAPLGTEPPVPLPAPAPKVKLEDEYEREHEGLRKEPSCLPRPSLPDRRRFAGERERFRVAGSDQSSRDTLAGPEPDYAGEIAMSIETGTETATLEFLLPSGGDDAAGGHGGAPTMFNLKLTTEGPGSISISASWRVGG